MRRAPSARSLPLWNSAGLFSADHALADKPPVAPAESANVASRERRCKLARQEVGREE